MAVEGWAALGQASVVGGGVTGSPCGGPRDLGVVRRCTLSCVGLCLLAVVGDSAWVA